jgi:transcriptional regulator with GAF, ATPase, and Fis domain
MPNVASRDNDVSYSSTRGFLVVRRGGRWTDLLRLAPDRSAIIGRASSNQIMIKSHQASRQHAEIRWDEGRWWVRDLGSRNGTLVDGEPVQVATLLQEGSCIEVAGCVMTFVTTIGDALATSKATDNSLRSRATGSQASSEDQLTMDGLGGDSIIHQASHSRYLSAAGLVPIAKLEDSRDVSPLENRAAEADPWQALFGLAYRLASAESVDEAAHWTLETLMAPLPGSAGGVFLFPNSRAQKTAVGSSDPNQSASQASIVAFASAENRSYRPPSSTIVQSVMQTGNAVIARNIGDDSDLQDADSRGEYPVTTAVVVPIQCDATKKARKLIGYLHVYTTNSAHVFDSTALDFSIAAAGVLAAAIESVYTRRDLTRSLKQSRRQIEHLRERLEDRVQIIGESEAIQRVKAMIARVAPTNTTVLIRGESGVGKELVAAAIHHASPRRDAPMVCLNCAALSPTLLESELFGHEKGAFTGATEQKKGKFESAHGGTLMLDEIGEMSIDLQAKLLRVLEGHPFERLGGHQPLRVDVRLVAATNRDLPHEVKQGRFRADLYYRLNVVEIIVPPLRDRASDVLPIANHYLTHFSDKTTRRVDGFTQRAADLLRSHSWPGNIRELRNVIERAVVLGGDETVDVDDLNIINAPVPNGTHSDQSTSSIVSDADIGIKENSDEAKVAPKTSTLDEIEKQHILAVLSQVNGNKSRAAILLGIERSTLDRKLKRFETKD